MQKPNNSNKKLKQSPQTYFKFWISNDNNVEIRMISKDKNLPHVIQLLAFLHNNTAYNVVMETILKEYPKETAEQIVSMLSSIHSTKYAKGGPVVHPTMIFKKGISNE